MRSFLRWAGSKRRILPELVSRWNEAQPVGRYVEPFMGSAGLFFRIQPKSAILGDLNEELVETYEGIRADPGVIHEELSRFPTGKTSYYRIRKLDPQGLTSTERSARFIYLNRYCFNGLYRTNLNGDFNVPYGGGRTGSTPSLQQLREVQAVLQRAELVSGDFEAVLRKVRKGDFVYMDPPYAVERRRVFREYAANPFGVEDLERFTAAVRDIDELGAKFLISYAYSREALTFFSGWKQRKIYVQRNVGGFADRRRKAAELLIANF